MKERSISKHKILSHPRYVRFLRVYLFEMVSDMGFSRSDTVAIKAAFTEAMNNVIQHAYDSNYNMPIIVEFHLLVDRIEIYIRDYGKKVARSKIKSRSLTDYRESGLGVFLMERLMDYINYDITHERGTMLKMVKKKS